MQGKGRRRKINGHQSQNFKKGKHLRHARRMQRKMRKKHRQNRRRKGRKDQRQHRKKPARMQKRKTRVTSSDLLGMFGRLVEPTAVFNAIAGRTKPYRRSKMPLNCK